VEHYKLGGQAKSCPCDPEVILKLGTEHFLPAVNTQEEKEEGKRNANKCWQLLCGLTICLPSWLSKQKILQYCDAPESPKFPRES